MNHYLPQIQLLLFFPEIDAKLRMIPVLAHKIDLDLIEAARGEVGIVVKEFFIQ